jgi:hypothetical protein
MSDSDDSLTEPDWTEPEITVPDSSPPPWRARRARRTPVEPERGRALVLAVVVAVVVLTAAIAAIVGTPSRAPAPSASDGVTVSPVGSYSSSVFCAAGTGTSGAATTIYLTNTTRGPVAGVMTSVGAAAGSSVPTVHADVSVPALATVAVNPANGLPAGSTATSIVFAGGGVVASQVVSGPNGWSTAPCASQVASQWSFAGGATTAGNALTLSLYNPTSTEAVVNVSFITDSDGDVTPPQYQGLVVPPGQLVEENVGDFVQNASTIATLVTAQAGGLVSSEFQQWSSGPTGGVSLRLGSPELSTTWRLAQTTALPQSVVDLTLANPGQTSATATLTFGLSSGSVVPHRVVVPPVSLVVFAASGTPGLPQQTPYSVTVTSTVPIVVGRSVQAPPGTSPPVFGSSSATTALAAHWLVPAPGIPSAPGTPNAGVSSLAVADPGPTPARVVVSQLGSGHPVAAFTVGADRVAVLGPTQVGGLATLTVSSTQRVNVEEDSSPSGAPGVVSSAGFPLDP